METFTITREIQLDMGHRIQRHASKCRNIHGHRYVVQAELEGQLFEEGSQTAMVMDFGFIKEDMVETIHDPYDHKTTLSWDDPLLRRLIEKFGIRMPVPKDSKPNLGSEYEVALDGMRLVIISIDPTAENLAKQWFFALSAKLEARGFAYHNLLKSITVWETPNCKAVYALPKREVVEKLDDGTVVRERA